ncbi:MAG: hypothetical protein ABEI06_03865 [Halobacteriaceae archaeon]
MQDRSYRTVQKHWGEILGCDPSMVLSPGIMVTAWERDAVEFLIWEKGGIIGAPPTITETLDDYNLELSYDLSIEDVSQLMDPIGEIDDILGPQFVGYCDKTTFKPTDSKAQSVAPETLQSLQNACSESEWNQSGIQLNDTQRPTFAVLEDERPIAGSQIISAHGVAGLALITHPEFRDQGHGKSAAVKAINVAYEQNLLPEYRTLECWESSIAVANGLGFEQVARSILVKLEEVY